VSLIRTCRFGQIFQVVKTHSHHRESYSLKITKSLYHYRQQALQEVRILRQINANSSPEELQAISTIIHSFTYQGHICIVTELLDRDLYTQLAEQGHRGFSIPVIQSFARSLFQALVALKRCGIIHGDLKPENVMLANPMPSLVKISDFSMAFYSGRPISAEIQSMYYRAPELVLHLPFSYPIDIWSLGCLFAELFLGLPVFPGMTEFHLLEFITSSLGHIPFEMIDGSPQKNLLFHADGTYKGQEQICRERRESPVVMNGIAISPDIRETILAYELGRGATAAAKRKETGRRVLFIDLLFKMLKLNPTERITPEEGLCDEFVTADFSD
jgi:dual specificity protein kinase YAK1